MEKQKVTVVTSKTFRAFPQTEPALPLPKRASV